MHNVLFDIAGYIMQKQKQKVNVLILTSATSLINNTSDITGQTFLTYIHHNYIICAIPDNRNKDISLMFIMIVEMALIIETHSTLGEKVACAAISPHLHTLLYFFSFSILLCPLWKIWVSWVRHSRRKRSATHSYHSISACSIFMCQNNMVPSLGIFNMRTDVDACDCTRGLYGHCKESALAVDSGRKIPFSTRDSNLC